MSALVICLSGGAQKPLSTLEHQTPLEKAQTPNLDFLASQGALGSCKLSPEDHWACKDTAWFNLLSGDPGQGVSAAYFEALTFGFSPSSWVGRVQFVTLADGKIAGIAKLQDREADALCEDLNQALGTSSFELKFGNGRQNYIISNDDLPGSFTTKGACFVLDQPYFKSWPQDTSYGALHDYLRAAMPVLEEHEINKVRNEFGENPATGLWVWGGGGPQDMSAPSKIGAFVSPKHWSITGMAKQASWQIDEIAEEVAPASFVSQIQQGLNSHGLVFAVYPNLFQPNTTALEKIKGLEYFDREVLGALKHLWEEGDTGILVTTDGMGPGTAAPFAFYSQSLKTKSNRSFTEAEAQESTFSITKPGNLIDFFLTGQNPS